MTEQPKTPAEIILKIENDKLCHKAFRRLNARERDILKMRWGIGYDKKHTLSEVGKKYNRSRERIRQIEKRAQEITGETFEFIIKQQMKIWERNDLFDY